MQLIGIDLMGPFVKTALGNIFEPSQGLSGVGSMLPRRAVAAGNALASGVQLVPTVGSVVILNFAEVIQLTEEYYAPSSLGSFNLQVAVAVVNNQAEAWTANQWEFPSTTVSLSMSAVQVASTRRS